MKLQVGKAVRDFELRSHDGSVFRLSDFQGEVVILFFYPKDDTPGCTKQSCGFRDNYSELISLGCQVFGVSSDSVESHVRFAKKYNLPFQLLSDPGGNLRKMWKVPKKLKILPGRVTYVIDRKGILRWVCKSHVPQKHVLEATRMVRQLANQP